jgi:hypothetical protein|tara:strand:+ start:928 stop:2217 length:1290 start_codon:yes stop_codon:yes gene_type:complete
MSLNIIISKTKDLHLYKNGSISWNNALLQILRENHYWPAIQTKKFYNNNNLILLHNTYKRKDVDSFIDLYNECRSVILDFSSPNVILCKAPVIPETLKYEDVINKYPDDIECHIAYDSTLVYAYYCDEWIFSTNTCTNIDNSKFNHPVKSYGEMFNESLPISREEFTLNLDKNNVYTFGIIHYDNKKYIDYTNEFGENYKKLILLNVKQKYTDITIDVQLDFGVINPSKLTLKEGLLLTNVYGLMFEYNNKRYKVSSDTVIFQEETDFGYPNVWRNMIWIYQKNMQDFHIVDYIKTYNKVIDYPLDNNGEQLDPTYLIHTTIISMRDILLNLYKTTTVYFKNYNRFKMSKDIDSKLPPILQYHLAQLRRQQITIYIEDTLTEKEVFLYLCYSNPMKNIIALINFFATNSGYDISPRSSLCFTTLNNLLI